MKWLMILSCWVGLLDFRVRQAIDLEKIRSCYVQAPANKKICRMMIEELSKNPNGTVGMAYLGAFKTIWAKHTLNPIGKLGTFNKGKAHIEQAVADDPENVEIRFVRLSVQKNCPSFLGYNKNIEGDSQFIHSNKKNISSLQLKKMLSELML